LAIYKGVSKMTNKEEIIEFINRYYNKIINNNMPDVYVIDDTDLRRYFFCGILLHDINRFISYTVRDNYEYEDIEDVYLSLQEFNYLMSNKNVHKDNIYVFLNYEDATNKQTEIKNQEEIEKREKQLNAKKLKTEKELQTLARLKKKYEEKE